MASTSGEPIDLLAVIGSLEMGGTETQLSQILPKLRDFGIRPTVLSLTGDGPLAESLHKNGIEIFFGPEPNQFDSMPRFFRGGINYLRNGQKLAHLLRTRQPTICHCFLPFANAVGGLASMLANRTSLVVSRRSLRNYQAENFLLNPFERFAMKRAKAVLGNSRAILDQLEEEGVSKEKCKLIYNGIDLGRFDVADSRDMIRRTEGIPEDAFVLIIVANFIPYKGHQDLFLALQAIQYQLPKTWHLLCVGREGTSHFENMKAFATRTFPDQVSFLGSRRDIPRLFKAADLAVLPSHQEGFSNSLLEGMAAGLPTVATNVGGNPEAIGDGIHGAIVPPRNPDALARAILALSHDAALRQRLGRAAHKRAKQDFSIQTCAAAYATFYQSFKGDQ